MFITDEQKKNIIKYNISDVEETEKLFLAQCAMFQAQDPNFKRILRKVNNAFDNLFTK